MGVYQRLMTSLQFVPDGQPIEDRPPVTKSVTAGSNTAMLKEKVSSQISESSDTPVREEALGVVYSSFPFKVDDLNALASIV